MRRLSAVAVMAATCLMALQARAASPFDGTYHGTTTPQWAGRGCGDATQSITIKIAGGTAWTHHHKLTGSVDSAGHLSLADGSGRATLIASIQGDQLQGTETVMVSPKKLRGFYTGDAADTQCTRLVSAERQ